MRRRILSWFCFLAAFFLISWGVWPHSPTQVTIPMRAPEASAAGLPEYLVLTVPGVVDLGRAAGLRLDLPGRDAAGLPAAARAEARLELDGMDIEPGLRLVQTVSPGTPIVFSWQIIPYMAGEHEGMLWLYWETGGAQLPVLARQVNVFVRSFFGLPVWVGLAVGGVLGLCGLILRLVRGGTQRRRGNPLRPK